MALNIIESHSSKKRTQTFLPYLDRVSPEIYLVRLGHIISYEVTFKEKI